MFSWRNRAVSDSIPAASLLNRSDRLSKATSSQSFDTSIPAFRRGAVTASLPCEFTFMTSATVRVTRLEEEVRCALTICSPTSSPLQGLTGLARITDNQTPAKSPEGVADNASPLPATPRNKPTIHLAPLQNGTYKRSFRSSSYLASPNEWWRS